MSPCAHVTGLQVPLDLGAFSDRSSTQRVLLLPSRLSTRSVVRAFMHSVGVHRGPLRAWKEDALHGTYQSILFRRTMLSSAQPVRLEDGKDLEILPRCCVLENRYSRAPALPVGRHTAHRRAFVCVPQGCTQTLQSPPLLRKDEPDWLSPGPRSRMPPPDLTKCI